MSLATRIFNDLAVALKNIFRLLMSNLDKNVAIENNFDKLELIALIYHSRQAGILNVGPSSPIQNSVSWPCLYV